MAITPAVLTIGTGSNRIDLLDMGGFFCVNWQVGMSEHEGSFSESKLADYRQMQSYRLLTGQEVFQLRLAAVDPDAAAVKLAALEALLREAIDFWSTTRVGRPGMVYLQVRAACETNARYALVMDARLGGQGSVFSQPFLHVGGGVIQDELVLIIERGPWIESAPGTGTAVELGVSEAFDGITFGNVDSDETLDPTTGYDQVYISNHHKAFNINHAYYWDADGGGGGGAFSANLVGSAVPFAFLPAVPAAGDFVLFGILEEDIATWEVPFNNLVFDIGTAIGAGGGITIAWRYSIAADDDPTNWTALSVQDNTSGDGEMGAANDPFNTTGVKSVHWKQPSDWAAQDPAVGAGAALGVDTYWVCAYVSAAAGAPSAPTQDNRNIYTCSWPYVEMNDDQVFGDYPAMARFEIHNQSDHTQSAAEPYLPFNRILLGLRSVVRYGVTCGDFTAFLNFSDQADPDDIGVYQAWDDAVNGAFADDPQTPTGRVFRFTNPTADWTNNAVELFISGDYADQWLGRYRMFLRGKQTSGTAGDIEARIVLWCGYDAYVKAGTYKRTYGPLPFNHTSDFDLIDFGLVEMQEDDFGSVTAAGSILFEVQIYGNAAADCDLYDLILLPIDEWAGEFIHLEDGAGRGVGYRSDEFHGEVLYADSIDDPRRIIRAPVVHFYRPASADYLSGIRMKYRAITNGPAILQPSGTQRLWALNVLYDNATSTWRAYPEIGNSVTIKRLARYAGLRGAG